MTIWFFVQMCRQTWTCRFCSQICLKREKRSKNVKKISIQGKLLTWKGILPVTGKWKFFFFTSKGIGYWIHICLFTLPSTLIIHFTFTEKCFHMKFCMHGVSLQISFMHHKQQYTAYLKRLTWNRPHIYCWSYHKLQGLSDKFRTILSELLSRHDLCFLLMWIIVHWHQRTEQI